MSNESIECPLCMEPMDFDDVDFYPCPCRYQICRFCWDKIINEENGLCPACRKAYNSEHPASYKPRTEEEIKNKIKHSKKVCPKKSKSTPEGKEYLAEYRVLQKNLIFVVGLPMRMAEEVELLKGLEYFGRCGKVYKIVINQNQTFPGPQGTPCLSAYVTYHRNEDALKTLVDLKKLEIDGRAVKLSLGTTKYCSQFLRNRRCTKQDCMYLHDMGDQAASFTKEDMANGKHTEYENQLIQEFFDTQTNKSTNTSNVILNQSPMIPASPEQSDKSVQRKTSLTSSQTTTCVSCISTTVLSASSLKPQRSAYNCHIAPIGTDPNDATKIYSINCSDSKSKTDSCNIKNSQSQESPQHILHTITPLSCDLSGSIPTTKSTDLPFIYANNTPDNIASNSLLDSFYYLNSQSPYDQNINQQVNNNCSFPYKSDFEFSRSFVPERTNNIEHKFKDTADIDFDPINISRLGLAELIANESLQKLTPGINNYIPQMYAPQRNMLRPTSHDYMMQSNNEFYNNRVSNQSYLLEKQQQSSSNDGRINLQMSNINLIGNSNNVNGNTAVSVAPINSGYPLPPPGFEVNHNNGCIGEPSNSEMMNMFMNHNNVDIYNRYQNSHPTSDIPMAMNHHNQHYNNQYSIPPTNSYHNDFSNYSNGGGTMMGGYNNDLNSQSHPWKNAQSLYCDNNISQEVQQHNMSSRSTVYNRSHSMNENTGLRHSEWNGYSSYNNSNISHNNTNDPHMNNFSDSNFLLSMRGQQSVQCTTTSGNESQLYARQQTSHSVNH